MLDRVLGVAAALSMVVGTTAAPAGPKATVVFSFQDPAIVESSGLVATGDLFLTVNDSGDGGRVFVVDDSGRTVGTTTWADDPQDTESLAPAGPGEVWVGDTGDNRRGRDSITVLRVPYGATDREVTPAAYELVYPDRAHDAETLMTNPRTGQLFVVSKDVFGGTIYAAPRKLSADRPNVLRAVGEGFAFATDGAFFPDGRHYIVRGYTSAAVYSFPDHGRLGSFQLPTQQQGEGIAVDPGGRIYLSTEGQFSDLLRIQLPADVLEAMAAADDLSPTEPTEPSKPPAADEADAVTETDGDGGSEPLWPWALGGALVFVVLAFGVGAGWLLRGRGQAP